HHDTSYEILKNENIKHYYYTSDFCGTKIFFDKLSEGTRPKKIIKDVVDLVDTYDCWKKTSILWNRANDFMDLHMGSINYSLTESYKANYSFMKNMKLKLKFNNNFEFTESDLGIIRNR